MVYMVEYLQDITQIWRNLGLSCSKNKEITKIQRKTMALGTEKKEKKKIRDM